MERSLTLPHEALPGQEMPDLRVIREGDILIRHGTGAVHVAKVTAIGEEAALIRPLGIFFFRSGRGRLDELIRPATKAAGKEVRMTNMVQWRHWSEEYPTYPAPA